LDVAIGVVGALMVDPVAFRNADDPPNWPIGSLKALSICNFLLRDFSALLVVPFTPEEMNVARMDSVLWTMCKSRVCGSSFPVCMQNSSFSKQVWWMVATVSISMKSTCVMICSNRSAA
jgi:hypothetical protein